MTPIMYHIAVHMMTGQFLVIKGNIDEPETWEIMGGFNTLHDAEADIIGWEEGTAEEKPQCEPISYDPDDHID